MEKQYREMFDEVRASEQLRTEVYAHMSENTTKRRKLPKTGMIAAVLALALGTTALAVSSPTLQSWFSDRWAEETGGAIGESQAMLINSLTQHIGQKSQSNGVTVTADSITVGERTLWLLLEVEGVDADETLDYTFQNSDVSVTPDPGEGQTAMSAYSFSRIGPSQDGKLRLLLDYDSAFPTENQLNHGDYTLEITLKDLASYRPGEMSETVAEGEWTFSIPLMVESLSPVRTIDSAVVEGLKVFIKEPTATISGETDSDSLQMEEFVSQPVQITLRDIRVTATGMTCYSDQTSDMYTLPTVTAILSDGSEITSDSSSGGPEGDGVWYGTCRWPLPLNVEDITALRFGDTTIPLNG